MRVFDGKDYNMMLRETTKSLLHLDTTSKLGDLDYRRRSETKDENLWDGCPGKDMWDNKKRQKTECGYMEKDINEVLQTRRLTYFWHVTRMEKDRYPNILMHGYTHRRRPRRRPKKRQQDNITENCEELNLTIHQASHLANDRVKWTNAVRNKGNRRAGTSSSSQRQVRKIQHQLGEKDTFYPPEKLHYSLTLARDMIPRLQKMENRIQFAPFVKS